MPFGLQPWHLLILLVVVVVIMGPKRLPEIGQAMGKTLRGFKDELDGGPETPDIDGLGRGRPERARRARRDDPAGARPGGAARPKLTRPTWATTPTAISTFTARRRMCTARALRTPSSTSAVTSAR